MDRTEDKHLQPARRPHKPNGIGVPKRTRIVRSAILLAAVVALGAGGYAGGRAWQEFSLGAGTVKSRPNPHCRSTAQGLQAVLGAV